MLEFNTIHNIDCMEAMKDIPDKYFELAIVDPPYGININMNMGRKKGRRKSIKKSLGIILFQQMNILKNFSELAKIKLYGVVITSRCR